MHDLRKYEDSKNRNNVKVNSLARVQFHGDK